MNLQKYFHQIAMLLIFLGALMLLYFTFFWFARGNTVMGMGMFVMGVIALSNFYLHRMMMRKNKE